MSFFKKNMNYIIIAVLVLACVGVYWYMSRENEDYKNSTPPPPHSEGGSPQNRNVRFADDTKPQPPPQNAGPRPAIVFIHANWCHNCTSMQGEWDRFVSMLPPQIEAVDLEDTIPEQKAIISQVPDVNGYPTIRLYPQGFAPNTPFIEYRGNRTADSLMNFVKSGGKSM